MHSDVLELFVILQSVPVIKLGEGEVDEVLGAGRISALDLVGQEATGEKIQIEFMEQSYIVYTRVDDFLIALRVKNSMAIAGSRHLLQKVRDVVRKNSDFIISVKGRVGDLKLLADELDKVLGARLPTSTGGMMKASNLIDSFLKENPWCGVIGIVTQESWIIEYAQNPNLTRSHTSNLWKRAVDILHEKILDQCDGAVLTERDAYYWVRPIPLTSPDHWWALVLQIDKGRFYEYVNQLRKKNKLTSLEAFLVDRTYVGYIDNGREINISVPGEVYAYLSDKIDYHLLPNLVDILRPMVIKEQVRMGPLGFLGELLDLIEYGAPEQTLLRTDVKQLTSVEAVLAQLEPTFSLNRKDMPTKEPNLEDLVDHLQNIIKEHPDGRKPYDGYIKKDEPVHLLIEDALYKKISESVEEYIFKHGENGELYAGAPFIGEMLKTSKLAKDKADIKTYLFGHWDKVLDSNIDSPNVEICPIINLGTKFYFSVYNSSSLKFAMIAFFNQTHERIRNAREGFFSTDPATVELLVNRLNALMKPMNG